MKVIADLHVHSRYSRATSEAMTLENTAYFAAVKGLDLVGTGDFTYPAWLAELAASLEEEPGREGIYALKSGKSRVRFVLQTEVCTVSEHGGRIRKVHHVILSPNFEVCEQINAVLAKYGDLSADGRPTLSMSPAELVEVLHEVDPMVEVFPAHLWTPWYGAFGSKVGFNSMEECYEDEAKRVYALETGLSSDPPMNWRVSSLDRYTILSSSDSHSPYPNRIGREATIFEVRRLTYAEIVGAIRSGDPLKVVATVETFPAYGKYHWSGHRACAFSADPETARKLNNTCPVCGRKLTIGVEQRVEELADRPRGYRPPRRPPFFYALPLEELLRAVSMKKPGATYDAVVARFGSELHATLLANRGELEEVVGPEVADAIVRVRRGDVEIAPGYNGVYGRLSLRPRPKESSLDDFLAR